MFRIIWLQFRHSLKVWGLTLFLFIVTGFLTGACLNAVRTIADHYPHLSKNINPTNGFYFPLLFGILTIFIVSSGVIKLVINRLSKEYILWVILGANPHQLSLLIGGQLALTGALGSFIGFVLAVPPMVSLDRWFIVVYEGSHFAQRVPALPLEFSLSACGLTVGFIAVVSGLAGYLHAHQLFASTQSDILAFKKKPAKLQLIIRGFLMIVSAAGLIFCYGDSLILTPQAQHFLRVGQFHEAAKTYITNLMLIILLSIIFFSLVSQIILPWLIKGWTWLLPRKTSPTVNTAFWNTIFDQDYLSSLISPLVAGSLMLTGITLIASEITNGGTNQEAATNIKESLVIFVGTPLSIILANVLTITIMTSTQKRDGLTQLSILGFTPKDLLGEKFQEAIIYSGTFLICGVLANLLLYLLIKHIVVMTHKTMTLSWLANFMWPVWLWVIIMIFIASVDGLQVGYSLKNQVGNLISPISKQ